MRNSLAFGLVLFSVLNTSFGTSPNRPATAGESGAARPVRIAVIDTGLDIGHSYLRGHIWKNPDETPGNGRDDDGNGYADDVHGWNFVRNDADVSDSDGHGTHVAGIVKTSIADDPAAPVRFELMPLKYYEKGESRQNIRRSFIEALRYAIRMRADIINISAGGPKFMLEEKQLMEEAANKGILVVAAAGNKKPSAGNLAFFPAAYRLPNIVSVAAAGRDGRPLPTSNLIPDRELFFVFGKRVHSSLPNNRYGFKTGSSQAAAYMTGQIASRLFALRAEVERKRESPVEHLKALKDRIFEKSTVLQTRVFNAAADAAPAPEAL